MNGSSDETQGLLDGTRQPSSSNENALDPLRSIGILASGKRESRGNNNNAFERDPHDVGNGTAITRPDNYGYLQHIQSIKPLLTPEDKSLPRRVRDYYTEQLRLVNSVEDAIAPKSDETIDSGTAFEKRLNKRIELLNNATLITNATLVVLKIIIALMSNSLSIISSLVDSAVDLLVSIILIWTNQKIKKTDIYKYPEGRNRLEPISVVILSVIMCSASVIIIFKSGETLDTDTKYFIHIHDPESPYSLPTVDLGTVSVVVMLVAIISKAILFAFCYRIKNPTMAALAEANLNDVVSNTVALVCGLIATIAVRDIINQRAVVIDPIGAILISIYIIIAWILQANRQIRRLSGITANPYFLQRITHVAFNYRPDVVKKLNWVQAVYHGSHMFVEVRIGLPGSMHLAQAHDIGAGLLQQLESIDDVDRAYVHLDLGTEHNPICEHKSM